MRGLRIPKTASIMVWDKKVKLTSKEEKTEVKARKDKNARQQAVPKDDRRLSGAEPNGRDEIVSEEEFCAYIPE